MGCGSSTGQVPVNIQTIETFPVPEDVEILEYTPIKEDSSLYLKIEDTFWEGKRKLIPDYSVMLRLDQHALKVFNVVTILTF